MTYLVSRNRDGFVWLVAIANGRLYWLHKQAPVGHRMRLGQKYREPGSGSVT